MSNQENRQQQPENALILTPRQEHLQRLRDDMAPGNQPAAIVPRTFAELITMCQALAAADLAPKALRGKSTDMALVIMTGAEVGLPPMASLRLYTSWDGVPRLMAEGVRAIILQSPAVEYFEMSTCDDNHATWIGKRRGRPEKSVTWTIERAKKAGLLNKENWSKYPQDMLNARASMQLGRIIAPDVVAGMVALEEARDGDFANAIEAESRPAFVAPPPPQPEQPQKRGPGRPPKDKTAEKSNTPGTDPFRAAREAVDQRAAEAKAAEAKIAEGTRGGPTAPADAAPEGPGRDRWGQPIGDDPTSAGGGPAPQSSEASTSEPSSTASTESAPADDGFGGEDPADSQPAPTVDPGLQLIAEFQAFLAGCKTQQEMNAGSAPFRQRSAALFKDGDQRFAAPAAGKPAGELAGKMTTLWAERKTKLPA